jgi:uncharacterized membrane protein YeaQ/YmgE (transglycosylase-associated protein family)
MNIVLWMLVGAVAGWAAYAYIGYNEARGMPVSILIGAFGGFIGGNIVAPMFSAGPSPELLPALLFAAAAAVAFLYAGNLIHKRWGV